MDAHPQQSPSASVEGILSAAEHAAASMREEAEERARQRIAEADRAADHRVHAAEEEAREILAAARVQAQAEFERALASRLQEAEDRAKEVRALARAEAREIVSEAHLVAREVVRDGTQLSRNLRDLSSSLRNNAERLLRDVRLAHGSMTARLDQAEPRGTATRATRPAGSARAPAHAWKRPGHDPGDELEVPEFVPPG